MEISAGYFPQQVFAPSDRGELPAPRVFISPQRYIQGPGVLAGVGRYLSLTKSQRVALLMSARAQRTEGERIKESLRAAGIATVVATFHGECSLEEIASHVETLAQAGIDCVIAAGGGKCIDAGKGSRFASALRGHRADARLERRALLGLVGDLLARGRLDGDRVLPE
jgi:glycerol dehydrogenase